MVRLITAGKIKSLDVFQGFFSEDTMNVKREYKILKYMLITIAVGIAGYYIYNALRPADKTPIIKSEQLQTADQIKQTAANAGISLSDEQAKNIQDKIQDAKPTSSVPATAGTVKQIAEQQRQLSGSDFAPVVSDNNLSKLPEDTPIELKQYHIYAAPKVQHEVGLKLDAESNSHISGISYGIKRRITEKGQYIGARVDYDWQDKEATVWATYSW